MATSSCANCISLSLTKQCLELKEEEANLSPSPCNQLESNTLTDNINLSKNITTQTNEQLLKSTLDVSSTSNIYS